MVVVAVRRGLIVVAALSVLTGMGRARSQSASWTDTAVSKATFSSFAGTSRLTGRVASCNGLIAFASNRAQDAYPEIYSISLDGHRSDVSRTIAPDSSPQPSPDGQKLAFWTGGQLFVADADGSHRSAVAAPGGSFFYATQVVDWSPDSRRLAVTAGEVLRGTSGTVPAVLDLSSGVWTKLGVGRDPRWSPDGSHIAWVGNGGVGSAESVFVARADGSERRLLALGNAPVWSPDGTRLLIGSGVVPIDGAAVTLIGLVGRAWTPDGSRILGWAAGDVFASVAADGSDLRVIAANARFGSSEVISSDGRRLAFQRTDNHVIVADLDGHVLRDLGSWPPPPMTIWAPRWSPDSSKILLRSGGRVIVADVNTGETRTLAGGPGESTGQPVWSTDGTSVLDAITDATGNTDIYVARPNGTGVRAVFADRMPEGGPAWSPDGRRLAFIRYGSPPSLVVTDLAGHARVLTTLLRDTSSPVTGGPSPSPPAWSPDGKTIAVAWKTGFKLVDVRTGTLRRWNRPSVDMPPVAVAWSPQGTIATTDGNEDSYISLTGTQSTQRIPVGDFYDPDYGTVYGIAVNLVWSPDGSKLAYLRYGGENGTGYFAWAIDAVRIVDTRTHKTRSVPAYSWDFSWSPDGRYLIHSGFDVQITRLDGRRVATLRGLRANYPSWQPLCQTNR